MRGAGVRLKLVKRLVAVCCAGIMACDLFSCEIICFCHYTIPQKKEKALITGFFFLSESKVIPCALSVKVVGE